LPARGRYEFIDADVCDADLAAIFRGAAAVVHLAAITNDARDRVADAMYVVNVSGTDRVARACAATATPLLFPSTTSVYGVSGSIDEDRADAVQPQTQYAEWKLLAERRIEELGRSSGLRYVLFRMGTVFGPSPGMRFHTAVNRFCWQALTRQPLQVWRTALDQFRPYLDLSDAIRAMAHVVVHKRFDASCA
jgi:nucleoside-diphosphate-sugar epimerase